MSAAQIKRQRLQVQGRKSNHLSTQSISLETQWLKHKVKNKVYNASTHQKKAGMVALMSKTADYCKIKIEVKQAIT